MLWLSTVNQFLTLVCLHPVTLMHSVWEKVYWVETSIVHARLHSQREMASIAQVCIQGLCNTVMQMPEAIVNFFSHSSRSLFKWSMWCQCHLCQGRVTHWQLHMCLSVSIHRREWIQLFRYWASSKRIICMWLHALIINCQPVPDPCLSTPCDPNALCVRESLLSGNFSCSCQAPFTVGDGFDCTSTYDGYDIHDLEQVHILCCFHIMQFQTPVLAIPVTSMPLVRGKKYSLIPSPVHAYLHSLKAMASIVQVQYPGLYYYYRKI